ncbi:hypothetical protein [Aureimonas sp. AU4]|uniref:hypothetical protein n=1 Tax=Aureimonas sp. AU4 TaxID=1638163 RepID=UPI0007064FFA|nr:hypothetical protein [Aureimonas sp. AU4]BAT30654.1 hypothetical protein [Aureimonas sp. AU4]
MKTISSQFYLDRAAECRLAAAGASLAEVRRKYADAEERWQAMASLARTREDEGRSTPHRLRSTH